MANTAFNHDPALTVAASNTTAGAAVKWVASKNLGESLIILDSGGNGRIGLAGDLDLITLTTDTVTVAGTVAATTLTGAGSGITALAAGNIATGTVAAARLGSNHDNARFLRGDNTWQAVSGGPSQATQAALAAATNEHTYEPPDLWHHHPGMIKVWGIIGGGGDLKSLDYNVASVTDTGTGERMIIFTTAFSSNLYCSTAAMTSADTNQVQIFMEYLGSASQIRHRCYSGNSAAMSLYDAAASFQITGDQS